MSPGPAVPSPIRWSLPLGAALALAAVTTPVTSGLAAQDRAPTAGGEAVAVVVQAAGAVLVERRGGASEAASPGTRLSDGDHLTLADGARAVLLYGSGRTRVVEASLAVQAEGAPEAAGAGLFRRTVATLGQVARADARARPNRQGMIRPIPGAAVAISPRNGVTVRAGRPTFSWFAVPDATSYTLQLRPEGGAPVRFEAGADTVWTLAETHPALAPGTIYMWTVAADPSGRPALLQSFRVATAEEQAEVDAALALLAAAGLDPEAEGLLVAAVVLHDAGFLYDARAALDRLEERGELGREARLLRAEILDALGELEAAARDFEYAAPAPP
jgi:hypothetical protein